MTLITDALLARRDRVVAALYAHPKIRETLTIPEITTAVDTALAEVQLPELLDAVVKAEALNAAIAETIPSPPPAVVTAVSAYAPSGGSIAGDYNVSEP